MVWVPAVFRGFIKRALQSSDKSIIRARMEEISLNVIQKLRPGAVVSFVNNRSKAASEMMNTVLLTLPESTDPPKH